MKQKIFIRGWQSQSPAAKSRIEIPKYNFSPFGEDNPKIEINPKRKLKKPISGWNSWYAFYKNISERKILKNARLAKRYLNSGKNKYIVIDNGWTKMGNWLDFDSKKFPNGLKSVSQKIKALGVKPGIWISPFLAEKESQIFCKHPEFFVKNGHGFEEGFKFFGSTFFLAPFYPIFDLEKERVFRYVKESITYLIEGCEFELLKLDYLYSIYFNSRYKDAKVPDQILKSLLSFINKTYPDVYTIGCCCPFLPTVGLLDAMRISQDNTAPEFDNVWPLNKIVNSMKLNQLEKNLRNRKGLEKIWNIDPDAFTCRSSTGLSEKQISKLFHLIKSADGLFFLGDDLTKLPEKKIKEYFQD